MCCRRSGAASREHSGPTHQRRGIIFAALDEARGAGGGASYRSGVIERPWLTAIEHPHQWLRTAPDPVLRQRALASEGAGEFRTELGQMLVDTVAAMYALGVAAPQLGFGWRMFAFKTRAGIGVACDPELELGTRTEIDGEACLSLPGLTVPVERAERVKLHATTLAGEPFELELGGLEARIVQHEADHLEGTLITDRGNVPGLPSQAQRSVYEVAAEIRRGLVRA